MLNINLLFQYGFMGREQKGTCGLNPALDDIVKIF